MTNIFLEIFNMSASASWLILVIVLMRFLLRKAPKSIQFSLWILVGIKLLCPFTFESAYSLIPSKQTISMYAGVNPNVDSGFSSFDNFINPHIVKEVMLFDTSITLIEIVLLIATIIWIIGVASMLIYSILSYEKLQRKTEVSILVRENIYMCDYIYSPFVLGIIKPIIFIPSDMDENLIDVVLAHEYTHIKRKDHIWKMIGFIILSLHWFNPFLWLAFILFTYDMEISCDEKTIQQMSGQEKKQYCNALISLNNKNHIMFTYPLAFGEIGVKERVKQIVNYKKSSVFIAIIAGILCMLTIIGFLCGPLSYDLKITYKDEVYKYSIEEMNFDYAQQHYYRDENNKHVEFYGESIYFNKLYNKMGLYEQYGRDDLKINSVLIISKDGEKYEIKNKNGILNSMLFKEKDESLTYIETDLYFNILKTVKNVKEIILYE